MKLADSRRKPLAQPEALASVFMSASSSSSAAMQVGAEEDGEEEEDAGGKAAASLLAAQVKKNAGNEAAEGGDYHTAMRLWREALDLNAEDFTLYELKAQALLALDEFWPAVHAAQEACRRAPEWADGHVTLARCQREVGEVSASIESYEQALRIEPTHAEATEEIEEMRKIALEYDELKRVHEHNVSSIVETEEAQNALVNLSLRATCLCSSFVNKPPP